MLPGRSSTVSCAVPKERVCAPFRRSGIKATEPPRRLHGLPSNVHAALHSQIRCISVEKRIVVSNCFLDERTIAKSLTALSLFRNLGQQRAGSTEISARQVPARSDHSPRCGNAVCNPGIALSFARRHIPAGTESAPVHRQPDGRGERRSCEGRAVRETESDSPLLSVSRHPK